MDLQDELAPSLQSLRREVAEEYPGAALTVAGVSPHAAAGTASARREVSVVGVGSLAGIFLLLAVVFCSLSPFFMWALGVGGGCLAGFAACLGIFGKVPLLTLVFGARLVAISIA